MPPLSQLLERQQQRLRLRFANFNINKNNDDKDKCEKCSKLDLGVSKPNTINATFPYRDLNSDRKEIRLVTIQPASNPDATVVAKLSHAFLDGRLQYETLSYTWGPSRDPSRITLDNKTFRVTRNLHAALLNLRLSNATRTIWIDAICINQLSIPERNAQVQIMGEIYQGGAKTMIWIGPAFQNSDALMDYIAEEAVLDEMTGISETQADWNAANVCRNMQDPGMLPVWRALERLCEQEYWGRMWIVQEAALGPNPQVCVGRKSASFWDGLTRVLSSIAAEMELAEPGEANWEDFPWAELTRRNTTMAIGTMRHDVTTTPKEAIWLQNSLIGFRKSKATDPRDKVFALLGFFEQDRRAYQDYFKIDYAGSVLDIYLGVFEYCSSGRRRRQTQSEVSGMANVQMAMNFRMTMGGDALGDDEFYSRAHGPLNILTAAGLDQRLCPHSPTWLPNWGKDNNRLSINELTGNRFTATLNLEPRFTLHHNRTLLRATGIRSGTIERLGSAPTTNPPDPVALVATIASWQALALAHTPPDFPYLRQAFWMTLTFDSYPNRNHTSCPPEWQHMVLDDLAGVAGGPGTWRPDPETLAEEMLLWLGQTTRGRRFAMMKDGPFMMVPEEARVGDMLVWVFGCDIPLLVRGVPGEEKRWVLVGECYGWGYMEGEAMRAVQEAADIEQIKEEFDIV